jgi:hypothetical protein
MLTFAGAAAVKIITCAVSRVDIKINNILLYIKVHFINYYPS